MMGDSGTEMTKRGVTNGTAHTPTTRTTDVAMIFYDLKLTMSSLYLKSPSDTIYFTR
jgi:hypothetical protein